jgi:hypothetical protein
MRPSQAKQWNSLWFLPELRVTPSWSFLIE